MAESLSDYIKKIDNILKDNKNQDYNELLEIHLDKIRFFQHERLIHLIVTISYALFLILFVFLTNISIYIWLIVLIFLIVLLFYIIHYYKLENGVQYLYYQYDEIRKKL